MSKDWYEDEDIETSESEEIDLNEPAPKDEKQVYISIFGWGNWKEKKKKDPNRKDIILFDFTSLQGTIRTIGSVAACIGIVVSIILFKKKQKQK